MPLLRYRAARGINLRRPLLLRLSKPAHSDAANQLLVANENGNVAMREHLDGLASKNQG
jgi:hypothetical protein